MVLIVVKQRFIEHDHVHDYVHDYEHYDNDCNEAKLVARRVLKQLYSVL